MANWLCVLNRENFEIVKREGVWGVNERHKNTLRKLNPGDICAFYLRGETRGENQFEPCIGGIFIVSSLPYFDETDIFLSKRNPDEKYPYRVRVSPYYNLRSTVPFKQVVPDLSFIVKKHNYGCYLLGRPLRELSKEDMAVIEAKIKS